MSVKITCFIYYCTLALGSINHLSQQNYDKIIYLLMALFCPYLVLKIFDLVKLKYTSSIILVNYWFCFFSLIIGNLFKGYSVPYFDKVLHFTSGILITLLFAMLFKFICNQKINNIIKYGFILGMNMLVAYLWELFEYLCLVLLDIDAINHYTQGVYDTMNDMSICFVASVIIIVLIAKNNKLLNNLINDFVAINIH